jgi:CBS domain-containing protein
MRGRRVKDIMISLQEYATVSCEATLREALIALSKAQMEPTDDRQQHRAILALDKDGEVVGKLTYWAILRSLEPKFLTDTDYDALSRSGVSQVFIESIQKGFSIFQGTLPQMCRKAARIKVGDAMVPANESIDENESLTEAIRLMVLGHWQSMLVTRDERVVGILRLADVFEEVADLIRAGEIES